MGPVFIWLFVPETRCLIFKEVVLPFAGFLECAGWPVAHAGNQQRRWVSTTSVWES